MAGRATKQRSGTAKQTGKSYLYVYLFAESRSSDCKLLPWMDSLLNRCGACRN